jgi:protein-tyrosine phosphatase
MEIVNSIGHEIDFIIDSGRTRYGESSTIVRVSQDNQWEIIREGVIKKENIKRLALTTIIFICTGNTCRSPMAVGLFKKMLADKLGVPQEKLEDNGYKIISGGTAAVYGMPASNKAVEVLKEYGADISGHSSQPVTLTMIEEADRVYVMTKGHMETLKEWMPSAESKIFMLDPAGEDIADPISGGVDVYRQSALKIKSALEARLNELI